MFKQDSVLSSACWHTLQLYVTAISRKCNHHRQYLPVLMSGISSLRSCTVGVYLIGWMCSTTCDVFYVLQWKRWERCSAHTTLRLDGLQRVWSGGVSDTAYMQDGDVFPDLYKYLLISLLETQETRNIDPGFCVTSNALNTGGHYVFQPIFASPDEQFTTEEVHESSTVATDHSRNKRMVK
jgi:hypothetical protein